mmetsp:Transcript_100342/g.183074  ORF Transcript_100342/g.183074 Transcript_100342/m.183074 type:complete len:187 (+) Transcript_100342:1-561(+)
MEVEEEEEEVPSEAEESPAEPTARHSAWRFLGGAAGDCSDEEESERNIIMREDPPPSFVSDALLQELGMASSGEDAFMQEVLDNDMAQTYEWELTDMSEDGLQGSVENSSQASDEGTVECSEEGSDNYDVLDEFSEEEVSVQSSDPGMEARAGLPAHAPGLSGVMMDVGTYVHTDLFDWLSADDSS